jgi:hypothetical protein
MFNYQKYVDEMLELVLVNHIDFDDKIQKIHKEVKNIQGTYGLLILLDMLSNQIGNEHLGCLHDIQSILFVN